MRRGRPVNPALDRPVYKQVADDLRQQIHDGDLQPGEGLPSEARLGHEYHVGLNTIRAALAILRGEGLVVTERAVGSHVRSPQEPIVVVLPPNGRAVLRTATEDERIAHNLPDGALVLEVSGEAGTRVLPARPGMVIEGPEAPPPPDGGTGP